ncbi:SDR family NAD(P)-dependent oxidoreductase [Mycolicibacterium helvum]|nr:SDR family oxidoreductase [Mycolicibacterium helvum]
MTTFSDQMLAGKTAVVTGVNGGIAGAIADALKGVGAAVVGIDLNDNSDVALDHYFPADLSQYDAVRAVAADVEQATGGVDVLVNAAAITRPGPAINIGEADWDPVLDVNAKGLFFLSQEFARGMAARGHGKIVNFASRCAYVGYEDFLSYNASKAAVVAITNTMAVELGAAGVQVNAIAPGFVMTPMTAYVKEDAELDQRLLSRIPMRRYGTPAEAANLVLFLASPASDYVTGVTVPLDGGMLVA